jgi:hypothetical protein
MQEGWGSVPQLLIGGWQLAAIIRSSVVSFLFASWLRWAVLDCLSSLGSEIWGHVFRVLESQEYTAGFAEQQTASLRRDIARRFAAQINETIDHNDLSSHPIKRSVSFADVRHNDPAVLKYSNKMQKRACIIESRFGLTCQDRRHQCFLGKTKGLWIIELSG